MPGLRSRMFDITAEPLPPKETLKTACKVNTLVLLEEIFERKKNFRIALDISIFVVRYWYFSSIKEQFELSLI